MFILVFAEEVHNCFSTDIKTRRRNQNRMKNNETVIEDIPLHLIDDFPNHPFIVYDDDAMTELSESINTHGVITPAIVRPKDDGRYELIAGHRRKRACTIAQVDTMPCEVRKLSQDEATILMVESNYQRTCILPSEKAFAYKMRSEALKKQGQRTDLTSTPVGSKLNGSKKMKAETGDSKSQINRYIRLTYLIPELLELVDKGQIKMRPAVELSFLEHTFQYDVMEEIHANDCTPSHAQAIRMHKAHDSGTLTSELIQTIMHETKPNQYDKIILNEEKVKLFLPNNLPLSKREDYICQALKYYKKFLKHRSEQELE